MIKIFLFFLLFCSIHSFRLKLKGKLKSDQTQMYAIESVYFPGKYIRMDATGCNSYNSAGCGTVNGQVGYGAYEKFYINLQEFVICIQSVQFPNNFLRLQATGCNTYNPAGCGQVNTQYYTGGINSCGPYEQFKVFTENGDIFFESNQFPRSFLRFDANACSSFSGSGCGTVNSQHYDADQMAGGYEVFNLIEVC